METKTLYNKLLKIEKNFLAANYDSAFLEFYDIARKFPEFREKASILFSSYNHLKNESLGQRLSSEDKELGRNRLGYTLISYIREIEITYFTEFCKPDYYNERLAMKESFENVKRTKDRLEIELRQCDDSESKEILEQLIFESEALIKQYNTTILKFLALESDK